uniref:Uncharacterized protein n=1 Tax=Pyxicephalus adspersus TaxID=30357 RepID=A0AAV3BA69_PYXAD|nr:TPA: hypothetical protein GDO54_000911 [Pyxicephalus adspersus]
MEKKANLLNYSMFNITLNKNYISSKLLKTHKNYEPGVQKQLFLSPCPLKKQYEQVVFHTFIHKAILIFFPAVFYCWSPNMLGISLLLTASGSY